MFAPFAADPFLAFLLCSVLPCRAQFLRLPGQLPSFSLGFGETETEAGDWKVEGRKEPGYFSSSWFQLPKDDPLPDSPLIPPPPFVPPAEECGQLLVFANLWVASLSPVAFLSPAIAPVVVSPIRGTGFSGLHT